jgi:hypothetical protein
LFNACLKQLTKQLMASPQMEVPLVVSLEESNSGGISASQRSGWLNTFGESVTTTYKSTVCYCFAVHPLPLPHSTNFALGLLVRGGLEVACQSHQLQRTSQCRQCLKRRPAAEMDEVPRNCKSSHRRGVFAEEYHHWFSK